MVTVIWSDLDVHILCKPKFYTVSSTLHVFVESTTLLLFSKEDYSNFVVEIFLWGENPSVFLVSTWVMMWNTCFMCTVSVCCQNITRLKTGALPGGAELWEQLWLEFCMPHFSFRSWIVVRLMPLPCTPATHSREDLCWGDVALREIKRVWKLLLMSTFIA